VIPGPLFSAPRSKAGVRQTFVPGPCITDDFMIPRILGVASLWLVMQVSIMSGNVARRAVV